MVKVRAQQPENADGSINIDLWLKQLVLPSGANIDRLQRACRLSLDVEKLPGQDSDSDTNSFRDGLEMAEILADLRLDEDTLIAAILYRAVREEKLELAVVGREFGPAVVKMIDGVSRMAAMSRLRSGDEPVLGQAEAQKENIRKMLVALVDDVRVALIKLAERTIAIRGVKNNPAKRYQVAKEVSDIYAPLAHRLGIGHIKWELEDLSFRYLEPNSYKKIAKLLDEKRLDRQHYIESIVARLNEVLQAQGIEAEVSGRAKHIYSIWRKMQRKGIGFSQVYDIRAVRILVPEIKDCYAALGLVHGIWRNVPNEFDDYIANPKENGYRSLHTAVIGPEGKVLEVQIRTHGMHEEAEYGVCAHWLYKGTDKQASTSSYDDKIAWLRQVLDWHEEMGGNVNDVEEQLFKSQDRVYVFTPEGHVVNLAFGSTPLDFAYHIHTEVGHRCRGSKVNGRIVPLTYTLQTGEQVEILTGKENAPRRDWLQPSLGYLKSSRARAKVQHWFKQQAREDNIQAGRALLEKTFKRLALTSLDYKAVARRFGFNAVEDMYAAVGAGDISSSQVVSAAQQMFESVQPELVVPVVHKPKVADGTVIVRGVGNLLTHFAGCCKPVPGDLIIGYITVGRGVSIHRQDCAKVLQLQYSEPDRIIEVDWGQQPEDTYPVDLEIEAFDRRGLLRDITTLMANAKVDVIAVNTLSDKQHNTAIMRLTVEITDLQALGVLLTNLNRLPNIINASRISEGG